MRPRSWITAALGLGVGLQVALVLSVARPPIQDYPNHLLRLHAWRQLETTPVYAEHLASDLSFRPNLLMDAWLALLAGFLPLELAGRLQLASLLALGGFAAWLYLRHFAAEAAGAFFTAYLLGAWVFHKGFLNFQAGVALGLVYLVLLWPQEAPLGPRRAAAAALVALGTLTAHAFAFLAFGALAGAAALMDARRDPRRCLLRLSTLVPGGGLLLAYVVRQASAQSGILGNRPVFESSWREVLLWDPLLLWYRFHPWLDRPVAAVAYLLIAAGALVLLAKARRKLLSLADTPVLLFALAGGVLYLLMPNQLSGGWAQAKMRMLHVTVLAAMPLLAAVPHRLPRRAGVIVAAAGLAAALAWNTADYRRFDRRAAQLAALAEPLPRGARLLNVDLTPRLQTIRPTLHAWAYLCLRRDCLSPYLFASPYAQSLYFEHPLPRPPGGETEPEDWLELLPTLAEGRYDAFLLQGRSEAAERALAAHLELAARNGAGSLYFTSGNP